MLLVHRGIFEVDQIHVVHDLVRLEFFFGLLPFGLCDLVEIKDLDLRQNSDNLEPIIGLLSDQITMKYQSLQILTIAQQVHFVDVGEAIVHKNQIL